MNKNKQFHLLGAVIATGLLSFSGVLIETAMNVTFPQLITEFGLSTSKIQWVATIYLLAIAIIIPLSSYFNQRFSSRKLFISGNLLFFLGVLINCFSPNFPLLLAGRLLQGVGTGIALPLMFHLILTKAPLEKRGMMMGLGTVTTSIAPAIGPTYGGIISNALDWRYIYIFLLPLIVVSLIIGLSSLPEEKKQTTKKLALRPVLALSVMFFVFISALSAEQILTFVILFIVGILSALLFVYYNRKETLIELAILRHHKFVALLFTLLVYQGLLLGLSFILPNFIQVSAGYSFSCGWTLYVSRSSCWSNPRSDFWENFGSGWCEETNHLWFINCKLWYHFTFCFPTNAITYFIIDCAYRYDAWAGCFLQQLNDQQFKHTFIGRALRRKCIG